MAHTRALWQQGGPQTEAAARALRTIVANILDEPGTLRYRRVREAGARFASDVGSSPGALAVLTSCGFTRETYPDGVYWVLKAVDAEQLAAVRRELAVGLQTFERIRSARAPESAAAPSAAATATDAAATLTAQQQRQLRARSVVHRVHAAQLAEHASRKRARCCWALAALAALLAAVLPALALAGTSGEPAVPHDDNYKHD